MKAAEPVLRPNVLALPVGALLKRVEPIEIDSSIARAAKEFRDTGLEALPLADRGEYAGCLRQSELLQALAEGLEVDRPVSALNGTGGLVIKPYQSGADALRMFADSGVSTLIVIDDDAQVLGVITPACLFGADDSDLRPRSIGGMATPLGVYLTNGVVSGGASKWGLVLTGMLLFSLLVGATFFITLIEPYLSTTRLSTLAVDVILSAGMFTLFLLGLRVLPLAGTHAAEHMTVHAIERGERLTPEIVSRMPRVHPRCGTNIAAAATLFLGIMSTSLIADQQLRLVLAALVTLILWRPLGNALQYFVTTKPPTKPQIESGIAAGNELLANYRKSGRTHPSVWIRLWNSGLPEVVLGTLIVQLVLYALYFAMGKPGWLGVYF